MLQPLLRVATAALIAGACIATGSAQRNGVRVWATHDGTKVLRDDLAHPDRNGNAVWDGKAVRLVSGRNETIAFQVIVEAASRAASLEVSLAPLVGSTGAALDASVDVMAEHYLHVTQRTRATWVFRPDTPAAPSTPLGWIPVALVPSSVPSGRASSVAAQQTQAYWVELHVARSAAPTTYRGHVQVHADGATTRVPVELEVLDVTLPDVPTLPTIVYYERSQTDLYHGRNMDREYHQFAHRHRVEFTHAYDDATVAAARSRFDGNAFARRVPASYAGPGLDTGNRVIPRTFYGPGRDFDTDESARTALQRWKTSLEGLTPLLTFVYLPDEPTPPQFARVKEIGTRVRNAARGMGSPVKTFVTHGYTPELADAVDIWAAVPAHYDVKRAAEERKAGKQMWFYNGGRPQMGAIIVDAPATDPRVVGWAAFRHDVDGYFYWHANHWRHNSQKKIGDRHQNVWVDPITFDNRAEGKSDNGIINGDGVLVFPGEDVLHPDQNRNHKGPIDTIQFANLRRGLQDHMLLTMARAKGLNTEVQAALDAVVPRVLSDAGERVGFSEDGNEFERARQSLLRALARR
ncbi:MAG TPA: glycoside hydrolase domain-containing protein [Luteitalea sp.]|nr:glycoside hydrolase domain-containing protein [Luteitalea sp.]